MLNPNDNVLFKQDNMVNTNITNKKFIIILLNDNSNDKFNFIIDVKKNFPYIKNIFIPDNLYNIKINKEEIKNRIRDINILENIDENSNSFFFNISPYIFASDRSVSSFYFIITNLFKNIISKDQNINLLLVYCFNRNNINKEDIIKNSNASLVIDITKTNNNFGKQNGIALDYVFTKDYSKNIIMKIFDINLSFDYFNVLKSLVSDEYYNLAVQKVNEQKKKALNLKSKSQIVNDIMNALEPLKNLNLKNLTTSKKVSENRLANGVAKEGTNAGNIINYPFLMNKNQANNKPDQNTVNIAKNFAIANNRNKPKEVILSQYSKIKNALSKISGLSAEVNRLLKKKDYVKACVYVNDAVEKYENKIYTEKPNVQTEVLKSLDEWSSKRGYDKPTGIDPIITPNIINNNIASNFHRAMAQKEMTWEEMPSQIEELVTPVLADAGFKFLSISMEDAPPDPTQVEPTYMTYIKIRFQNTRNKKIQTVRFMVFKLFEGKYHISGGIKYLFPNILATLPIFVVAPGKIQLKSNYSAITFEHVITNKKNAVTVVVGGIKIPLLAWLLQLKSFNDICKDFGIEYEILESTRGIENKEFIIKLPERKYMLMKINSSDLTIKKMAMALFYDLQPIINKCGMFDLTVSDNAKIISNYTNRSNTEYVFSKIKKFFIDGRTASLLKTRQIDPDIYNVSKLCSKFSITDIEEDKLGINSVYIRLMDMIPAEIERAFHYAITEYRRKSVTNPDVELSINEGWVINSLRKQSVLLPYKDGNPTIETSQFTSVRLVGPGGFTNTETVQVKDRRVPKSHFGEIDPIDTPEGNPGVQIHLASGFEYDPDKKTFTEPEKSDKYHNMFSSSASMIPFVSHDDGNRAQFGCSQGRQVVPIVGAESPLVATGMECYLPAYASEKFVKKAKRDGTVLYSDSKIIIVKYDDGTVEQIDIRPDNLQTGSGKSNGLIHTSQYQTGQRFKAFENLVSNSFMHGNAYSSGLNVLAAFKTENAYTYEDGIVVSESFAKRTVSTHYDTIDIMVDDPNELKVFPTMRNIENGKISYEAGEVIVKVATSVFGGLQESSVVAPTHCEVVDIKIYPAKETFIPMVREIDKLMNGTSNSALKQYGLKPLTNINSMIENVGKFKFRKNELTKTLIRIVCIEYRMSGLGDKLNNRHGNKGVITKIMPDDMMPVVPDGRHVDVCFNPLGIIGRMNMGQVYEMHVGNILDTARIKLDKMSLENARNMLIELYTLLDGTTDKKLSKQIVENLMSMNNTSLQNAIEYLKKNGIRMVFPAYETPKMDSINKAAKLVGAELESKLWLPQYKRYTINKCTWGMIFVNKLEHISSIKQNTRSVGKSISTTMMPGKPGNHRNAIRLGEYDTWGMLSYDANTVLKEFFEVNGDNPKIKNQVIRDIENDGVASIDKYADISLSGSGSAFSVYTTVAGLKI